MSHIIASTYEILREIGSGGGGVVYLGRHLRLDKDVVLKADRRGLSARPESLRREVDALKNLSHTYIPQVYDFVEENGVVYTVMDFIDGESLDKPLKRGEQFSPAQIIEWAVELLEALCYLHSRPPHGILHADIKPANVMRTPQGDIRLIDFNIALALGAEGAVRVGYSQGYASPEHYGVDYKAISVTRSLGGNETQLVSQPAPMDPAATVLPDGSASGSGRPPSRSRRGVLLDVRSDIYSLGATLYHLFTGVRPAVDAKQVDPEPLKALSPAVADILQKAMDPDPDRRYQTAEEMRTAFLRLHDDDPRTRRHRRRCVLAGAICALALAAGAVCTMAGLKWTERAQTALALAEQANTALAGGDAAKALALALEALPTENRPLTPPAAPQARRVLAAALGVYDLNPGFQAARTVTLPAQAQKLALSPAGTYLAALSGGKAHVFRADSGAPLAALPAAPSALADLAFNGEDVLIYAGADGLTAYALATGQTLWTAGAATAAALSADGTTVAAVNRDESQAVVYDAATGETLRTVTFHGRRQSVPVNDGFADPEGSLLALNADGTLLAASFSGGGLRVFDLRDSENDLEVFDTSAFTHFEGGFCGKYFSFTATGGGQSVFVCIDTASGTQTGGFSAETPFHTQAGEGGVYLSSENLLVRIDPATGEQAEAAYTGADLAAFAVDGAHTLTLTEEGELLFFDGAACQLGRAESLRADLCALAGGTAAVAALDSPIVRLLALETHPEAEAWAYDAAYPHDEARISADNSTLMLYRYDGFRLYGAEGQLLAEAAIPDPERVYDQQYRRDGKGSRLEVLYYDGTVRSYSAADGGLLDEADGTPPDGTLAEEFFTDDYRVESPLHGAPTVYDRESGAPIKTLEGEDYLTYVTQLGEYIVTEYVTAAGERYGLLRDGSLSVLADLPGLCDILPDGTLMFDDHMGTLRQSRVYSLQELAALGESRLKKEEHKP